MKTINMSMRNSRGTYFETTSDEIQADLSCVKCNRMGDYMVHIGSRTQEGITSTGVTFKPLEKIIIYYIDFEGNEQCIEGASHVYIDMSHHI